MFLNEFMILFYVVQSYKILQTDAAVGNVIQLILLNLFHMTYRQY